MHRTASGSDGGSTMRRYCGIPILLSLFCYAPGILLPALRVEKLGRSYESSILDGCLHLFTEGELFLGSVVALTALVLPPLKLGTLFWFGTTPEHSVLPGPMTRGLEFVGRFSCLEVFLVAVLVALVRLSALVRFQPRAGLYIFALSSLLGLAASVVLNLDRRFTENPYERPTV